MPATRAQQPLKLVGESVRGEGYCSKIKTAGFGSFSETTTNFDGETVYMIPFPPMLPAMVPLPFVGVEETL
jgi:hypothetical protein